MKSGHKITEFGEIPESWQIVKLKNIGKAVIGLTYSPEDVVKEGGTLVLRSSNIKGNRLDFEDQVKVSKAIPDHLLTREGDILICARNGSKALIGKNALINNASSGHSFGAFMSVFRTEYSNYVAHLFQSDWYKNQIKSNLGATINQVTTGNLESFKFPFPPADERSKIAEILSTVDEKIEVIEKLILQTSDLKKGLMQRLLTKGIGQTAFKNSPLGEIPESWEVSKLGQLVISFAGGTPLRSNSEFYQNGTIPWVKSGEVNQNNIIDTEEKITEKAVLESSAKIIKPDSLLVALYGATAGNVGMLRIKAASNQAVLAINSKTADLINEYVYYFLKLTTPKLLSLTQGSGQPNLSKGIIDGLIITIPPVDEQRKIVQVLSSVDDKLEILQSKKGHFQDLKKGLMQKLLTGKLRVNHLIQNEVLA